MDINEIRELVRLMVDNDLAELDITDGDSKIRLKRGADGQTIVAAAPALPAPVPAASALAAAAPQGPEPAEDEEELIEIKSPMVGTFYSSSSPDSDAFIGVGSSVSEDTVVCIVEAMKVMNEIKAECAGTITQVCVKDAQPVEYGQVFFKVKSS